jgi:acyl carrier protein
MTIRGAQVCLRRETTSQYRLLEDQAPPGDHADHPRRHCGELPGDVMSSVQDTVFDIIAKESGIDRARITPQATLKDLEIQSLDAVQIIFEIEDHFKITMPDRDPNFDTESVKGLVEAVEKLVAGQIAQPPAQS